jgi:hypothetical protein
METSQSRNISVLEPIGAAVDKTSEILFRPFALSKWFALGLIVWLAALGSGGGGGGGNFNYGFNERGGNFQNEMNELKNAVLSNLLVILMVGSAVALFILVLSVVLLWIRTRFQFIFLNSVAKNSTDIGDPWRRYASQGNSLFLFKLILMFINIAGILCFVIPLVLIIVAMAQTDFKVIAAGQIVIGALIVLGIVVVGLLFSMVYNLTTDLVVPMMYIQNLSVTQGWKRLLKLLSEHLGVMILYLLFIFLISIALGIGTAAIGFAACCCFCCVSWVFLIPLVGGYLFTVLTLPLWVWRRAYSASFLAQFGPEYNVFYNPQAPVTPIPVTVTPKDPNEPPHSPELDFM